MVVQEHSSFGIFAMKHVLLFFLLVPATFARDLSLHSSLFGPAPDGPTGTGQRTLRDVTSDHLYSLRMRHVEAWVLRNAMNGGASLKSFLSFNLDASFPTIVAARPTPIETSMPPENGPSNEDPAATNAPAVTRLLIEAAPTKATGPRASTQHQFDFIVGGFPKCGTTTLLKAFGANPETDMVPEEQCAIAALLQTDDVVVSRLKTTLLGMETVKATSTWQKQGFKCPTAIYSYKSIVRLEKHSPNARIIIGIRHPILMLESFYNYRVTELYERGLAGEEEVPFFLSLMDNFAEPWKGVSIHSVRFEFFLQQLGKTALDQAQLQALTDFSHYGHELAVKPSNFTIFCYTVDQLEDTDEDRSALFRNTLQEYLGLTKPLPPFGHENKNHAVGMTGHPETINICDDEFSTIRANVLQYARQTASWIQHHFIKARDVVVANREHFLESLHQWEIDPCEVEN
jgi:hypothetical protein